MIAHEVFKGSSLVSSPGTPPPFGALLRQHRLTSGLSQEALAERSGLSVDAIRAFERGRRKTPRPETLNLLMTALDLSQTERSSLVIAIETPTPSTPLPYEPVHTFRAGRRLPHPPGPLIGREREMISAGQLLFDNHGRLLTLLGPGGVGKTRLTLELLVRHQDAFDDGAVFVGLAPLRDPGLVPAAIADALGVREIGQQDIWSSLLLHLQDRRLLLALDNFEQIVDAAPLVGELLLACPHLTFLVTSRMALNLRAEQRFPVQPLATLATPALNHGNLDLMEIPSVRLFAARAKAVQPDFQLNATNVVTVAAICARLDGLPLAIELAAARVALLPPEELFKRLIPTLPMLTDGPRDLPERQRTLRATIDWSYELLASNEQTLFRRLSVFARGCTLEAAANVCLEPHSQGEKAIQLLTSLVDGSLLRKTDDSRDDPRILMLEMVREYANELLDGSEEAADVRQRHAAYYLALAESAEPSFGGQHPAATFAQLDREHDNLRAALSYGLQADPDSGLRLAASLWQFWWARGHLTEGREWLDRLLAAVVSSPRTQARGLLGAGCLAIQQSDWSAARVHLEAGLALSRAQQDHQLTAWLLRELGSSLSYTSNYWPALSRLEEALFICRRLDDPAGLEASLLNLARVLRSHGEYARARSLLKEALSAANDRQSSRSIAAVRVVLGDIARYEEDLQDATAEYAAGLAAAQDAGQKSYEAWALAGIGQVALWRGETARATSFLEKALAIYRDLGSAHSIGFVLHSLGLAALRAGDDNRAIDLLKDALALRWQLRVRPDSADSVELLALVAVRNGQTRHAVRLFAGADAARSAAEAVAPPIERALVAEAIQSLRSDLGGAAFMEIWTSGTAVTLETLVPEALNLELPNPLPKTG